MPSEVINGKLMHIATEQIPGEGEIPSRAVRCIQLFSNHAEEPVGETLQYRSTQVRWSSTGRLVYPMLQLHHVIHVPYMYLSVFWC